MEFASYLRFGAALVLVLGLIGIAAWGARRLGFAGRIPIGRGGTRRLSVVEVTALDPRRRLAIVRRDGVEHLLLLGQAGDMVIERDIAATGGAPASAEPAGEPGPDRSAVADP